jgi:hypothetical protein
MNEGASLLPKAQLKERGWTPALVKKFLGAPDATKPNPYYRSAAPTQLYALARVEACEQEDGWKQEAAKAAARSLVGKTVAARKAAELVAQAETLPITVRRLPLDTLLRRAIASYNAFHEELLWERGHDYERASEQSDPAFLERITVNFIRHELTEYDEGLEEVAGRIGVDEAAALIRQRVYAEIARIYPEYADECKRQIRFRHGEAS